MNEIVSRRFPLTCEYKTSTTYVTNQGTMIRLEKTDGRKEEFQKDIDFLNKIDFIKINVDYVSSVIEIIVPKEGTMKFLETYIMILNGL